MSASARRNRNLNLIHPSLWLIPPGTDFMMLKRTALTKSAGAKACIATESRTQKAPCKQTSLRFAGWINLCKRLLTSFLEQPA